MEGGIDALGKCDAPIFADREMTRLTIMFTEQRLDFTEYPAGKPTLLLAQVPAVEFELKDVRAEGVGEAAKKGHGQKMDCRGDRQGMTFTGSLVGS